MVEVVADALVFPFAGEGEEVFVADVEHDGAIAGDDIGVVFVFDAPVYAFAGLEPEGEFFEFFEYFEFVDFFEVFAVLGRKGAKEMQARDVRGGRDCHLSTTDPDGGGA